MKNELNNQLSIDAQENIEKTAKEYDTLMKEIKNLIKTLESY